MEEYAFREVLSCGGIKRTGIQDVAFLLENLGTRMIYLTRMNVFGAHG